MSGAWLVLGATSPLARAFAIEAADHGAKLFLAARDADELATIAGDLRVRSNIPVETLAFDAGDAASVEKLAAWALEQSGPVSVFAGHGIMPDEKDVQADAKLAAQLWEVNCLSIVRLLNRLTPKFEAEGGSIVVIGSVAGDRGRKKNYQYGASKAGLAGYIEGLGARLSANNVSVLLVKPGVMDTGLTWGLPTPPLPLGSPEGLARAIWLRTRRGGTLYYPWFWFFIMQIIRQLPNAIFNKLNF